MLIPVSFAYFILIYALQKPRLQSARTACRLLRRVHSFLRRALLNIDRPKRIVVIGGGIVGLCSAYYLAKAGHEVAVLERHGNVAEEASLGQPGIIAPSCILPPAIPEMPSKILPSFFRKEGSVIFKPQMDRALWRWLKLWMDECEPDRYRTNTATLQRLARYSQQSMREIEELHQPEFEQTEGAMRLFRTDSEMEDAQAAHELLASNGITAQLIDADATRALEPGLSTETPLAGALVTHDDLSGNCPLFAKQLKNIAQSLGVQFHFNSPVNVLEPRSDGVGVRVGDQTFFVDAVVVAAGCDSMSLLAPLGVKLPLQAMKGYAATAAIKNYDAAPLGSVVDPAYQVAISRMGNRVRVTGVVEPGVRDHEIHVKAMRTLIRIASDWFPNAANYNTATFWAGVRPVLPEGIPIIGSAGIPNLHVNIGHGAAGWPLAAGSGRLLADMITRQASEIDLEGLTLSRYG
jgi:D-amino-acid dehydrogenase